MPDVLMRLTVHARGSMATKLLEAADELGLGPEVVRSQTEGFQVPEELHRYLFPSQYDETETETGDEYDAMEWPELRQAAKDRDLSAGGTADDIKARLREADAAR